VIESTKDLYQARPTATCSGAQPVSSEAPDAPATTIWVPSLTTVVTEGTQVTIGARDDPVRCPVRRREVAPAWGIGARRQTG
jgi:hypothetical protein